MTYSRSPTRVARAQSDERVADLIDELRGQTLGGLIEQQESGIPQQRPPDREHLLLATGQLVPAIGESPRERREQLEHATLVPATRDRSRGEQEVLAHAEVGEDAASLRDQRDAGPGDAMGRRAAQLDPAHGDRTGACAYEAGDGGDRRRLAGTVAAHDRDRFARADLEVDPLEDMAFAVVRMQPGDAERAHPPAAFPSAFPR